MSKNSRRKNRKKSQHRKQNMQTTTQVSEPEEIAGMTVVEEKITSTPQEIVTAERNPAKPLDKETKEKIKVMPQTYTEDVFNVDDNKHAEEVITNNVKEKVKKFITVDELLESRQFKNKLDRIKKRIDFNKSFEEVLDFVKFSKLYRSYHIDDTTDEIDVLLNELVLIYKSRLSRIKLPYEDYQKVNAYFDSLKSIYRRFNHGEGSIKDDLKLELEKLQSAHMFIRLKLF